MAFDEIFGAQDHITPAQECARAVIVFVYGLILVRVAGRRAFGKWSALDIIVAIMVGSNLSRALTGGAGLFGTLLATTLLLVMHWICAQAAARIGWASRLLEGRPVSLGESGRVDRQARVKHGVSQADIDEALRAAGLDQPHGSRTILLEPSGKISVLKDR